MKKGKKNYVIAISLAVLFILTLTGCGGKKQEGTIQQILRKSDNIQTEALYAVHDDKLLIQNSYFPNSKSPVEDTESNGKKELTKKEAKQLADLKKEFPDEDFSDLNFGKKIKKEIKHGNIKIDKDKREVTLTGDNFTKTFKMDKDNDKRLTDNVGNEYELQLNEKQK